MELYGNFYYGNKYPIQNFEIHMKRLSKNYV